MAVRKAITSAIRRVEELDPAFGRVLRTGIHTGSSCGYDPDPSRPVAWLLEETVGPLGADAGLDRGDPL